MGTCTLYDHRYSDVVLFGKQICHAHGHTTSTRVRNEISYSLFVFLFCSHLEKVT